MKNKDNIKDVLIGIAVLIIIILMPVLLFLANKNNINTVRQRSERIELVNARITDKTHFDGIEKGTSKYISDDTYDNVKPKAFVKKGKIHVVVYYDKSTNTYFGTNRSK